MVYVGRDLKDHLVPTPLPWGGTPRTRTSFLRAPSSLVYNTDRDRASATSLGNLFQSHHPIIANNFLLTSRLNLLSFT